MTDLTVQSSYIVYKVFILLTLVAVIDFLVRNFGEVPDDYTEGMIRTQSLLELIIIVTFFFGIVPMWVDKVRNAGIKRIIEFSAIVIGVLIITFLFPEYAESASRDDNMRLIIAGILIAFLAVYYIAGYIWGKKHAKNDGEGEQTSESERTEDDPEKD